MNKKENFLVCCFLVCLSRKMLTGKGFIRARYGFKRKGIIRAGYRCSIKDFLFPLILEIQEYHQNEPRSSGVYSRNNLPNKIKDGAYIIDLDQYSNIRTHWFTLHALNDNVTHFDSFGVEHISKDIIKFIDKSLIITNICRMQAYNSIMCGFLYWIY